MSQPKEIGTLVVVVLKAQDLHQPSFYKQDPYAQATLAGQTQKTKADKRGGQHPVWDEEFRFPVYADAGKNKENRLLEVACYKQETRGDDTLLGKGTVDIEPTLKTGEFDGGCLAGWLAGFVAVFLSGRLTDRLRLGRVGNFSWDQGTSVSRDDVLRQYSAPDPSLVQARTF